MHLRCQAQPFQPPLLESPALGSEAQQFQPQMLESPALGSEVSFVPGEHVTVQIYCCALTYSSSMYV
eukprot:586818-Amphidinium_carterae.2